MPSRSRERGRASHRAQAIQTVKILSSSDFEAVNLINPSHHPSPIGNRSLMMNIKCYQDDLSSLNRRDDRHHASHDRLLNHPKRGTARETWVKSVTDTVTEIGLPIT
ncbi:hypothetical protein EVAR_25924_1 [Eumeta japonica]|uniref:Uncharacterized protein n=1 Tax=Eumeta variegata TaxID=151549 RepID=A0A4C1W1N5_EUMVA|nr:hypothetical protein EVAR_25924_1 [Eumeta japonica]